MPDLSAADHIIAVRTHEVDHLLTGVVSWGLFCGRADVTTVHKVDGQLLRRDVTYTGVLEVDTLRRVEVRA